MTSRTLIAATALATGLLTATATAWAAPAGTDSAPAERGKGCGYSDSLSTISSGSRGDAVRQAQCLLQLHGYRVSIDGAFGPDTDAAVRDLQAAYGLKIDGVVGPDTWTVLYSY
ncbi:peptidoglycan-binding domain-containing protein [Nocardia lijiangensis]|uniref:peptidoglycan-binding domain-containing protein n=1 Tax=Nocardia lijiangensis TaxID=299618 RepID=UPI00082CD624|nr:peptidoglycan-binding domain-containing protein [Nocardia lijiangensis]